jgi:drug/metabolite transporter (DMT)-like permease
MNLSLLKLSVSKTKLGVIWFLAHCVIFSLLSALLKLYAGDYHMFQIVFLQNIIGLCLILPFANKKEYYVKGLKNFKLHFARSSLWIISIILYTYILTQISLAKVIAICFTEPLLISLFAVLLLKEKMRKDKLLAMLFGFIGVLVVVQPGMTGFEPTSLLMLPVVILWAISGIVVKKISVKEDLITQLLYMLVISNIITLPLALLKWQSLDLSSFVGFTAIAALFVLNSATMSRSFKYADLTILMPYSFSQLIFVAIIDFVLFNIIIDFYTISGALIIVASLTIWPCCKKIMSLFQ